MSSFAQRLHLGHAANPKAKTPREIVRALNRATIGMPKDWTPEADGSYSIMMQEYMAKAYKPVLEQAAANAGLGDNRITLQLLEEAPRKMKNEATFLKAKLILAANCASNDHFVDELARLNAAFKEAENIDNKSVAWAYLNTPPQKESPSRFR